MRVDRKGRGAVMTWIGEVGVDREEVVWVMVGPYLTR